ncbi:hypothetical protein HMPREF9123_1890 [Neisseria bacilliformis ATCC BAA-1200]|uniref:Uncharacterized protein n=1 Tax=Neisseria bacilliformis ATCC BAA-1200 TaxID=888742 RepID=F2BDT6_9NEIS|nr:hypothetical protein HMPREF9123_1890 [Neisseria bacilliformis ATCC BAA-1200]
MNAKPRAWLRHTPCLRDKRPSEICFSDGLLSPIRQKLRLTAPRAIRD